MEVEKDAYLFTNYTKTFDRMKHDKLIKRLEKVGLDGKTFNYDKSLLVEVSVDKIRDIDFNKRALKEGSPARMCSVTMSIQPVRLQTLRRTAGMSIGEEISTI